jgi:glycosyltransferase involved in cell wall biosynthesis
VRFLFVGRNERRKGIEELNAAIRKLNVDSRDKFVFEFIGPIPPTKQVRGCEYHGEIMATEVLKEIYRRCDVLVVPSHSEGMPNVILEGMASGLAVVATNVGAVAALVGDDNGWLLEKPSEELIHEVLLKIINCKDNRVELRKARSVQKVNEFFTWEKVGAQTLDFMKSIVATPNNA